MNNKGSFKENGTFGTKIKAFFKESGFYIAIVVGLCALAAGAVFLSSNQILNDPNQNQAQEDGVKDNNDMSFIGDTNPVKEEPDQSSIIDMGAQYSDDSPYTGVTEGNKTAVEENTADAGKKAQTDLAKTENKEPAKGKEAKGEETKSASGTQTSANDNAATQDVVLAVVRPAFKAPLSGKIQSEYSMDKLVFSPTFNEWRTHSGIDVSAPRGEVVRSVGNGTVSEIKNDPRFGFTIVIDHNNGYKSLYANLATDQTMQVGQTVKQGDPIGSVGATAIFESAEPTHLHFELYKENKLVDPVSYIDISAE